MSSRHWLTVIAIAGTAALTLLATGCPEPADLDNPEQYPKRGGDTGGTAAGGSGTSGSATGGTPSGGGGNLASCETSCWKTILEGCVACHGMNQQLGQLDMASTGYLERLKDQPAKHAEVVGGTCPSGDLLINSANPMESWLLKKVSSQQQSCGSPMPLGAGLKDADLACATAFVNCVAMGGM